MVIINFLGILSDWLSAAGDGIMGTIEIAMRTLSFSLCTFIYQAIIFIYNIFEKLCRGRFLDSELLEAFSQRVGLILGLVMAFLVIFSLVNMVLDPDKINDKEMGASSIVKKVIIAVVMLGCSNFIFSTLYDVQNIIIEEDVISNLLLPVQIDKKKSAPFGNILAEELMVAFYHIQPYEKGSSVDSVVTQCEGVHNMFRNRIISDSDFSLGYECLNRSATDTSTGENIETFVMHYNWLISIIVGIAVVYFLFSYCISVGMRMIQLMFLEILAPMAFVSYVAPKKETMFSKWLKIYVATYIDVFIRIAIINFVIFILATIFNSSGGDGFVFWDTIGGKSDSVLENGFILSIIVIALLSFAKKAPELLKNIFGTSASGLGFSPSLAGATGIGALFGGLAGSAIGATGALVRGVGNTGKAIGLLKNGWKRNESFLQNLKTNKDNLKGVGKAAGGLLAATAGAGAAGLVRGGVAGNKAKGIGAGLKAGQQAQAKANIATAQRLAKGVSNKEYLADKAKEVFGIQTGYQELDKRISENQSVIDAVNGAKSVKVVSEQTENIKENIAVTRANEEMEFRKTMGALGINVSPEESKDFVAQYNRIIELENKPGGLSDDEKQELSKLRVDTGTVGVSADNILKAHDLMNKYIINDNAYNVAIQQATKKLDDMTDAVYCLTTGDIDGLKKIDGVTVSGEPGKEKYYIDGTEVTNWGSIGEIINSYNERYGTNYKCIGDFKKENGQLRTESAKVAHRKTG